MVVQNSVWCKRKSQVIFKNRQKKMVKDYTSKIKEIKTVRERKKKGANVNPCDTTKLLLQTRQPYQEALSR